MTGDVQLPSMIDPEAHHVEFRATQCAECGETSPLVLPENPEWYSWMSRHHDATGHTKIYQYTITRNRGEHNTMGTPRARRTLGGRGR